MVSLNLSIVRKVRFTKGKLHRYIYEKRDVVVEEIKPCSKQCEKWCKCKRNLGKLNRSHIIKVQQNTTQQNTPNKRKKNIKISRQVGKYSEIDTKNVRLYMLGSLV